MDKDRLKGKVKDISGRVQRQAGEWTGDEQNQVEGAAKQVEGKVDSGTVTLLHKSYHNLLRHSIDL